MPYSGRDKVKTAVRAFVLFAAASWAVSLVAVSPMRCEERKGEIIDRIVAVVEDRSVLQSEVELEIRRYMMQEQRTFLTEEEEKELKQKIIETLIAERLLTIHAEKRGIVVADEEIDSAVERVIEENKRALGGDEVFERQLAREGMTIEQLRALYRDRVRSRMVNDKLMYSEIMGEIQVTEGEVNRYYRDHAEEPRFLRPPTVSLANILIVPGASEGARTRALEKALDAEKRVRAGEDFAELAKEISEGPSARFGGSLGYVKLEDLENPTFEAAVRGLKVGEVSGPVLTKFGYHLIKLEDVSGDRVLVRHILFLVESGEDDLARTKALADSLRGALLDGADFGETAARYSKDYRSKDTGGVLGDYRMEDLPEFFREVIEDVPAGGIAPVIKDTEGFRVVKVLGRSPARPYTLEEARDEIRKLIEQTRIQERIEDYVDGLKEIYYVEVKGDL